MRSLTVSLSLFILWYITARPISAQQHSAREQFQIEYLTVVDGLPSNTINAILEDHLGFLWLGTEDGLARYDGYSFKTFRHDPEGSTSIGGNEIWALHEDARGNVWAGGGSWGLSRYDREREQFINYHNKENDPNSLVHNDVRFIYSSPEEPDIVWIGARSRISYVIYNDDFYAEGGISRLDVKTGRFTNYAFNSMEEASFRHITGTLIEDTHNVLWVAGWGINRFEGDAADSNSTGHFVSILPDSLSAEIDPVSAKSNLMQVAYIAPSEPEIIWLGGWFSGLHRFDKNMKTFVSILPFSKNANSSEGVVRSLLEDNTGTFWVGTSGGLYTLDRFNEEYVPFGHQPLSATINAIQEDSLGVLWIGSNGGLMKLERRVSPFKVVSSDSTQENKRYAVLVDRKKRIWLGKDRQLERIDPSTGQTGAQQQRIKEYPGFLCADHYEDKQGMIWILGQYLGKKALIRLDPETDQFTSMSIDRENGDNHHLTLNKVVEDASGALWVGTWGDGLIKMDPIDGSQKWFRSDLETGEGLVNDQILSMMVDHSGSIWIGTEEGISTFDPVSETFKNFQNSKLKRVMDLLEDSQGQFWAATQGEGLLQFNPDTGDIERSYTTRNGLLSNSLYAMLEDNAGRLWISSGFGLFRLDPLTERVSTYSTLDGLPFNQFQERSSSKSSDGTLYFGGVEGVIAFHPNDFDVDPTVPEVWITDLEVSGVSLDAKPGGVLKQAVMFTDALTLPHDQNSLQFGYVDLRSIHPEKTRYSYILEGYDKNWIDAGTERKARYQQVPPDSYTFRVEAVNSLGEKSTKSATLEITITPPWWGTPLAYIIYGLTLIMGVFGVDRFQRRRLIARERLRAEREKAKAIESTNNDLQRALKHLTETQDQLVHAEKMASLGQLTAGVAHEIKNPLNFINNFSSFSVDMLEELKAWIEDKGGLEDPEVLELMATLMLNVDKINEHGKRADGIVRSMLEHSQTGRGKRRVVDLNKLVDEYVNLAYHGASAREEGFEAQLNRSYDETIGKIEIYPQEIGRVLINLLDNAFYSVNEKRLAEGRSYVPQVSVSTTKSEGQVEVHITDNGFGISAEIREKIFEPFFTTKPVGMGTGLGLSLSYDIVVQGHGGNLTTESELGEGATFVVALPLV